MEEVDKGCLLISMGVNVPSVLWCCWLGGRKGIRPLKNWVVRCWHGYLSAARCRLAYGPDDATATHCLCISKIQIGFTFLVPAHPGSPGQRAVKQVCVCVLCCSTRYYVSYRSDWYRQGKEKTCLHDKEEEASGHSAGYGACTRLLRYLDYPSMAVTFGKPRWSAMNWPEIVTVSGSGISGAICKSASRSRQITTPALHHSVILQAGCPSCRPTNSVKALKALAEIV